MKIKKITFTLICLCVSFSLCGQRENSHHKKIKYGVVVHYVDGKKRTQKQQLTDYLKGIVNKKTGKISYCEFITLPDSLCDSRLSAKDSIQDTFKIVSIEKKKNNFQLENGKIKKVNVNLIEISSTSDSIYSWHLLRIISEDNIRERKRDKIEVGKIYSLLLISCFDKDCCWKYSENAIIQTIGHKTSGNIFINNTWIYHLYSGFNYYTTPNLQGLYYIPSNE